jgi:hypothetical protein
MTLKFVREKPSDVKGKITGPNPVKSFYYQQK